MFAHGANDSILWVDTNQERLSAEQLKLNQDQYKLQYINIKTETEAQKKKRLRNFIYSLKIVGIPKTKLWCLYHVMLVMVYLKLSESTSHNIPISVLYMRQPLLPLTAKVLIYLVKQNGHIPQKILLERKSYQETLGYLIVPVSNRINTVCLHF